MRRIAIALLLLMFLVPAAWAKFTGIVLSTPFPDQAVQSGRTAVIPLTIHNFGLDPQPVKLKALSLAKGWSAEFQGGARDVGSVFVEPDGSREVSLRLTPPKGVNAGEYTFRLAAEGKDHRAELPIYLHLAKTLPDWLSITASLPTLKGAATTQFSYDAKISNKSGRDILVNLSASAPQGFEVAFKPQYGAQEVTGLQVKAGEDKNVTINVNPPGDATAGAYDLEVQAGAGDTRAALRLHMVVSGKPSLVLTTPTGQLSGEAQVGRTEAVTLLVRNTGSAPARDLSFSAEPPSHWKVNFEPKRVDVLPPNQDAKVTASIVPASQSLAGDYVVTFDAKDGSSRASANYRVTVMTSTMWGVIGIAIAALAVLVVGFAVMRYGRR
ncbi:MAG: ABC transporter substrate-binding protein [Burkholderiales bacterium]|nr:ABC transporter substrate-binding protein [Burkholderiales bacterium]